MPHSESSFSPPPLTYQSHERICRRVADLHQRDALPAVVLLHSREGYGKKELCLALARQVLGQVGDGAGEAPHSESSFSPPPPPLTHPELWMAPIAEPQLLKAHGRELKDHLAYLPTRGQKRVAVVSEVHRFHAMAFPQLLKILEEPPPYALVLLTSSWLQKVPKTLLSRCVLWPVPPPSPQEFHSLFRHMLPEANLTPPEVDQLRVFAHNSVSLACDIYGQRELLRELGKLLFTRDYFTALHYVEEFCSKYSLSHKKLLLYTEMCLVKNHRLHGTGFCPRRRALLSRWHRQLGEQPLQVPAMLQALVSAPFLRAERS